MKLTGFFRISGPSKIMLLVITLLLFGSVLLIAQKEEESGLQDESSSDMTLTRQLSHFRKVSTTASVVDRGNRIAAVRRLTLLVDDIDATGERIKRGVPRVEIELFSSITPPAVNSYYVVRIGDKEFNPGGKGCREDSHCTMVVMSPEEFDGLRDAALVSMRNGLRARPTELARLFDEGEPATVIGSKYGRLDKGMIERFPPVERPNVEP